MYLLCFTYADTAFLLDTAEDHNCAVAILLFFSVCIMSSSKNNVFGGDNLDFEQTSK